MLSISGCESLAAGARRSERCSGGWGLTSDEQRDDRKVVGKRRDPIAIKEIVVINRASFVDPA